MMLNGQVKAEGVIRRFSPFPYTSIAKSSGKDRLLTHYKH